MVEIGSVVLEKFNNSVFYIVSAIFQPYNFGEEKKIRNDADDDKQRTNFDLKSSLEPSA